MVEERNEKERCFKHDTKLARAPQSHVVNELVCLARQYRFETMAPCVLGIRRHRMDTGVGAIGLVRFLGLEAHGLSMGPWRSLGPNRAPWGQEDSGN